jgi:hypothetical protein
VKSYADWARGDAMRGAAMWLAWLMGAMAAFAADAPTISNGDVQRQSDAVIKDRVLDQLSDILIAPVSNPDLSDRQLRVLTYWTMPKGTPIPGLCRSDRVLVDLRSAATKNLDVAARVTGLRVAPYYYFSTPPDGAAPKRLTHDERKELDRRCTFFSPVELEYFHASDERAAQIGVRLVQLLAADAEGGRLPSNYTCRPDIAPQRCSALVAKLKPTKLTSVEYCNTAGFGQSGDCLVLWTYEVGLLVSYESSDQELRLTHVQVSVPQILFDDFQDDDD